MEFRDGKPNLLEFHNNSEKILRKSLLAQSPQEGCALLIGNKKQSKKISDLNTSQIQWIWPCINSWKPNIQNLQEPPQTIRSQNEIPSKENRFFFDPREQILAQKWARDRNMIVLGSAHSHPRSNSNPSVVDLLWNYLPNLMVILSGSGELKAWWIDGSANYKALEIPIFKKSKLNRLKKLVHEKS